MNQPMQLNLSVSEINQILEALGEQPFVKVYQLIDKIQQQTQAQLDKKMLQNTAINSPEANTMID
ncbi:hypothetical protein [Coleofasciculus sp. F4-SAH-05]|uniref:hypothetical protein n=1 Tax=Coleofasciculus sp. F4-SAH-05 TaxID=3069525 RepID=UPI003303522D